MVYRSEREAEHAARMAHHNVVHGKRIVARGPAAQRSKGHSAEYEGKLGYVPTCKNDKRRLTDCIHYINGDCTSGTEVHTINMVNPGEELHVHVFKRTSEQWKTFRKVAYL